MYWLAFALRRTEVSTISPTLPASGIQAGKIHGATTFPHRPGQCTADGIRRPPERVVGEVAVAVCRLDVGVARHVAPLRVPSAAQEAHDLRRMSEARLPVLAELVIETA